MNQNILTTYSLVAIKYFENEQEFYLANKSFIRDNVFLTSNKSAKDFQNSLFYIEVGSSQGEIKTAIQFGQKVVFRHKISNKYLTHSDDFQEEENDTTYKLKLSHKKHEFKILPCFQYQTKISNKIRFNQDVSLVTQINGAKNGYLSTKKSDEMDIRHTILGINQHNSLQTSKFVFHPYYEREKDQQSYTFGSIVWISHIESTTFLSSKTIKNKRQLTFQPIQYEKDLQSINGLWLIQSDKFTQGGKLMFQSKFRLKNLSTGTYMSFSGNYKMNQNERVYSITLDQFPSEKSQFVFKSLKGQSNAIKKNSYLILKHNESNLYIGCRKNNYFADSQTLKPISYSQFSDEDLFKIIELGENEDEALRFVLSIRQQLEYIASQIGKQNNLNKLQQQKEIFNNIWQQLEKLKKYEKLFQKVQGQIGEYIPILCQLLLKYRGKIKRDGSNFDSILPILKLIYEILIIICSQNRKNQEQLYGFISYFVEDIFYGLGTENLLIEIFKSNFKVLFRATKPISNYRGKNIIQVTMQMVERFSHQKNNSYWEKILKIIQFFFTLIYDGQSTFDMNQRVISQELFGPRKMFVKIFFGIKITNNRIKVQEMQGKYIQIDYIRNQSFCSVVEEVFKLFSLLASHRNFISKKYIHQFLSYGCPNNIEVMIAYLNMPITQKLSSSLYSLITNLYIDSSPRISRQKPLSVVNFTFSSNQTQSVNEEIQLSQRVKTALLNKIQQSIQSKPLQISNLLFMTAKLSLEPTLTSEELTFYKQEIYEKLKRDIHQADLLKSIKTMIDLESYSQSQLIEIFKILKNQLQNQKLRSDILKGIMQILMEISIYTREVEIKKLTAYLKYKFKKNELTINYERQYEYLLPFRKKLVPLPQGPRKINVSIAQYNQEVHTLQQLWSDTKLNKTLLGLLISQSKKNNIQDYEQIYNCLMHQVFHKKMFIQIIMNSIVVTSQESPKFQALFELFKKLKHLTAISEYWLSSGGENKENLKSYVKYMIEVINYLHQSYEGTNDYEGRQLKMQKDYTRSIVKEDDIYVNRQLLVKNIGFHKLVLELLQSNYYLLQVDSDGGDKQKTKESIGKAEQIFSLCFQFIYGFIFNCRQNKDIIHKAWNILDKFQNLNEVGQTRVYRELYKNNIEYIRQVKKSFIERIISKILKSQKTKTNQGCEFNPQFLRFLEVIVKVNGENHKSNFQKFYRLIEKETVFKKILYGNEQSDGKIQLVLDMYAFKSDIIQVPYIYHIKILKLFCDMVDCLESQSTIIKSKLRSLFNFNYLLSILAQPDIYTHTGLQAKMRFLLKRQVKRIIEFLIQRNDSIHFLHDNQQLLKLIEFYYSVFIKRAKKQKQELLNEALYLPYFAQYEDEIKFYENNQRKYFNEQIVPFLKKIMAIMKKTQKNVISTKISIILDQFDDKKMVQYFEYRKMGNQIDRVAIRWLNFVDKDQNNSAQQKFAKLSIVDLLRNSVTKKVLDGENQQFYKLISGQTAEFIDVLIRLISNNMEEEHKQHESHTRFSKIYQRLTLLRNILVTLPTKQQINQQINHLMERQIISNFIGFCIKMQFDFSKTIVRKIFHQILKIFIFILAKGEDTKPVREIYKFVNENQLCFRFWSHLSEAILTVSEDTRIQNTIQQVNWCLKNIYLNGESRNEDISVQGLLFIEKLCEYFPFTKFLRYQPMYPTKDFLQILYHSLSFLLINQNKRLCISAQTLNATQKLITTIISFMTGRNEINQNYIVDSKYCQILIQVLKIENIQKYSEKEQSLERTRLVEEVVEFYEKNGIDLSKDIKDKLLILDFADTYLLNRMKYVLLRAIIETIMGNSRSVTKLKFQIPIELIKINLIWAHDQYKNSGTGYIQEIILKDLKVWDDIVTTKELNRIFLMVGFYLYYLIEMLGDQSAGKAEDEDNSLEDKQKNKQKIVNKFFTTIADKMKKNQKLQKLDKQPFSQEMKTFYYSYYEALGFFKEKTLTIEVNFADQLTKVYFPKLPICDQMNNQIMQQFKINAVRISQDEKIKSLLEFQEESFDKFYGEEKFLKNFVSTPVIHSALEKLSEQKLRLVALICCFIQTILFLLENFYKPSFDFADSLMFSPQSALQIIMIIIGIINVFIGTLMLFYLIFKKSPILFTISSQKEKQRQQKERLKLWNGRKMFLIKAMLPQIIPTFIYLTMLVLSFVHPFFGSFVLFDIMNRLELGKQILRSVKQTWFQLLMATILLIMFNYLFALYVYIQFAPFYSPACQVLFKCLLLLVDQSLKSGSGFYGSTPPIAPDFVDLKFDLAFFSQMIYIIFAQKVMLEIFSGTIIDKFSQLREQAEAISEDQKTNCYICGQERFIIDFQLQGFEEHIQSTHNSISYVFYLFYLRKKNPNHYGVVQKFVNDCQLKKKKHWFPNESSILKLEKEREKMKEEETEDEEKKMKEFLDKKIKQLKQVRTKNLMIVSELRLDNMGTKS